MITLTGFTDEALAPFDSQLRMAARAGLTHVELRRVGATGVLKLSPTRLDRVRAALDAHGLAVSCLASGLGKAPVDAPLGPQLDALRHAAGLAHRFGTPFVRTFSWFTDTPDQDRPRVLRRMEAFGEVARAEGVTLLHENEKGVFGDVPDRCRELVDAGGMRLIFDPANFVQCGVRPFDEAWPALRGHVAYLHAKDASAATGRVTPLGAGDGQWAALAADLHETRWSGFASLEPHLGLGGRGGPITPRRWVWALGRVREVLGTASAAGGGAKMGR